MLKLCEFSLIKKKLLSKIYTKVSREKLVCLAVLLFGFSGLFLTLAFYVSSLGSREAPVSSDLGAVSASESGDVGSGFIQDEVEVNAVQSIEGLIYVEVAGAVKTPGVYVFVKNDLYQPRMFELIEKAGGYHSRVRKEQLNKEVNLVSILADGQQVYIPFDFEPSQQFAEKVNSNSLLSGDGESAGTGSSELGVSMNNASLKELQTLKGVGEVRSQNIIEGRPYISLDELIERKILTEKIVEDNADNISL